MARHLITALVLAVAAWMALSSAHAVLPSEMLPDPALEARARALSSELRCMVCQNQSIDDSDAPLAGDLRVLLRERIVAGDSDAEVVDFLVARYGEFILLRPQFNWHTALLWAAAPAVLLLAAIIAVVGFRNRRLSQGREPAPLDGAEREALERLVSGPVKGSNITDP